MLRQVASNVKRSRIQCKAKLQAISFPVRTRDFRVRKHIYPLNISRIYEIGCSISSWGDGRKSGMSGNFATEN